jgi:hypothetical protein
VRRYTVPTALFYANASDEAPPPLDAVVKQLPVQFNADGLVVEQYVFSYLLLQTETRV